MNTMVTDSMSQKIISAKTCADITAIETDIINQLNKELESINASIQLVKPIFDSVTVVLTAPNGSFGAIVGWINGLITFIESLVALYKKPYDDMILKQAQLAAAISSMQAQILTKRQLLKCI